MRRSPVRPIRLELQGFTSFRESCQIDFSKLDLFAITGPTGAGKSSLLDAITYALYGRTSRLGKSGRELISTGAPSMQLTFEFKAGAETYKIFRRLKAATVAVTARLEKREPDGSWTSITSAIKQMEEEVVRIVGLDFEPFTRAVILPQGKFDEFLRGDAAKRKTLLSELLNMSIYRKMMQHANSLDKEQTQRAEWTEQHIDNSVSEQSLEELMQLKVQLEEQESARKGELTAMEKARPIALELMQCRTYRQSSQKDAASSGEERQAAESQLTTQIQASDEKKVLLEEIDADIQAVKYDSNEHLLLVGLVRDAERQSNILEDISLSEQKSRQLTAELDKALPTISAAEVELQNAQRDVEVAQEGHESARREYASLIARYGSPKALGDLLHAWEEHNKKTISRASVETELASLRVELGSRDDKMTEIASRRKEAEMEATMAEARVEKVSLQNRAADLRRELRPGDACPVCKQAILIVPELADLADLDDAKREQKKANKRVLDCESEYQKASSRFELLGQTIAMKEREVEEYSASIAAIRDRIISVLDSEPGLDVPAQIDALASSLEKARLKAEESSQSLDSRRETHNQRDRQLQDARHAADLIKQQIAGLREQLQDLQRQASELTIKLQGRPGLEELQQQLRRQEDAKVRMDSLVGQRSEVRIALEEMAREAVALRTRADDADKRREKAIAAATEAGKKEQSLLKKLRRIVIDVPLTEGDELNGLDQRIHDLNEVLSSIKQQIERNRAETENVTGKLKKNQEFRDEAAKLRKSAAIYHDLAILLDLRNFQQYLLAASFTRLASDGSRYMADLTNARYSFTCNGDDFEVQDHWNGDEQRSVSTLSGGEAFLASLSLALALAQGIAELSGDRGAVALESLFLDEGFSTLDSETLGKVADALPLLQKSGRMIGVITHVESFAEQLPSQIEIIKTPTGSRVVSGEESLDISASA